jgi:ferritin-like metal-binding protein YciE
VPIDDLRKQLGNHLEETKEHQRRLQQVITSLGGEPTDSKGHLPDLMPATTALAAKTVKDTVKDTIKSVTDAATGGSSSDTGKLRSQEMELMKSKNDIIKEDSEVISYKLMIKTAEQLGMQDAAIISPLKQTLQEEERMAQWLMDNSPLILDYHWSRIKAALAGEKASEQEVREKTSSTATTA